MVNSRFSDRNSNITIFNYKYAPHLPWQGNDPVEWIAGIRPITYDLQVMSLYLFHRWYDSRVAYHCQLLT